MSQLLSPELYVSNPRMRRLVDERGKTAGRGRKRSDVWALRRGGGGEVEQEHTVINHAIRIMEVDTMITIRKDMDIVVLHARHVQPVQQRQRVLEMHVVVRDAVHHQEAHVGGERGRVGDGRVVVAGGVVLGRVHVAFGVDGVWCAFVR